MTITPHPELQQIVREETDDGREVVQFMKQAMNGLFPNFTPQHQLMAGRVLAILCIEQGIEFVESVRKPSVPRTRDSAQRRVIGDEIDAALSAAEKEIAGYVKKLTGGGRRMIRFLMEAMEGGIKSFSPSLRIAAGKELIGYAYPIFVPARSRDDKPKTAASSEPSPTSPGAACARSGRRVRRTSPPHVRRQVLPERPEHKRLHSPQNSGKVQRSRSPTRRGAQAVAGKRGLPQSPMPHHQTGTLPCMVRQDSGPVPAPTFRPLLPTTRTTGGTTRTGSYARRACAPKTTSHVPAPQSPGTRKTPDGGMARKFPSPLMGSQA